MGWFKKIFSRDKNSNPVALNRTHNKMEYIEEAIINHLNMKTTGALMLTGGWGSGKTYHIKTNVFPKIENSTGFIPIIVSLYGEADKNNIAQKVLYAFLDKKGGTTNLSTGTIAKNLKNISDAIPAIKKYVDLEKLLIGTGENAFKLLPHDKLLICFDDVERMSEKIDVNDFLGIVNDLVENKGCKVLLIVNEEEFKKEITYKEKTIEKTVHFMPDMASIFDSIVGSYAEDPFKTYLIAQKTDLLDSLTRNVKGTEYEKELKKSFSNIRTFKFAVEHFKYIFSLVSSIKKIDDDLTRTQLKNLWIFILSISVEFRKPDNISFNKRNNLDKPVPKVGVLSIAEFFNEQERPETQEDLAYFKEFIEKYYTRLSEQYIYYVHVYDLITAGKTVDKNEFIINVDVSFEVKEGKVNPAHEILFKMLHSGVWSFSNDEFSEALKKLLNYAADGVLQDIVSYFNAFRYLIKFHETIEAEKADIISKFKIGLEKFLRSGGLTAYHIDQFAMVEGSFQNAEETELVTLTHQIIEELQKQSTEKHIADLEDKFSSNISAFLDHFRGDESGIRTPDVPILHKFKLKSIAEALANSEPQDVIDISSFLKNRYLDTSFASELSEELTFLNNLVTVIGQIEANPKVLSIRLIKEDLSQRTKECIERLNNLTTPLT